MSATVDSVMSLAMTLSVSDQREVAERLWDQIDPKDDAGFDEATWDEIGRRVAASDAGAAMHLSGESVMAVARSKVVGRSQS